jgi:ABC-type tungstate transport system permease subunit
VFALAQGTGQALDTARRGDADVVFVHAKSAEEKFLAEGLGVKRYPVMYNDFEKAIADYEISGEQLFYPNANDPNVPDRKRTHINETQAEPGWMILTICKVVF